MAEYRLQFSADVTRSVRSIKDLKKEISKLTDGFEEAEIGSREFLQEAEKLSRLRTDLKNQAVAFRDIRKEAEQTARAITKFREGMAARGAIPAVASPIGGREDQFGSPAQLRKMREAQEEVERLARDFRKAEEAARRAKDEAVEAFRIGMKARQEGAFSGTGSVIASPLRGTAAQAGSPANREFVKQRRAQPKIDIGSYRALEIKLDTLRDKASRIKPDTEAWKRLQRNLRQTEEQMTRLEKKRIPRGERVRGAIGGVAKRGRQAMAGAGAAALAGGGPGTILGSGIGMMLGGPVGGLAGAGIGQAVDQLGAMAAKTVEAYNAVERMKRGLALASVDAEDFATSNRLVQESSQKLLLPLEKTYKHFSQLRVNTKQFGMTAEETQRIMEGTALAVASTGGSMEDIDGAMRAVVQIFSKGTVQAEELRGQLGERFPGAVVKFAQANKMSMQELQDALKNGQVGIAEFVAFAEQNFEDFEGYAESLATAPEYAGQRAKIAMDQLAVNIGAAFAPLGSEVQQIFADMMQGLSDFVRENKEGIDTFVRDLQIVIRRLSDFGRFVADLMGKIAGFLAPVIDGMRELFGLKSADEYKVKAKALDVQIKAVEEKRDAATGRDRQRLNRQLGNLRGQRTKALADAAAAGADETQQTVDRTRDSVTGKKTYAFGGEGAGLSTKSIPKGSKKDAGSKRKDISNDILSLEQEILRIEEAIAMKKQGGNELMLIEAQLALELAKINSSDMKTNEKTLAIQKAESKALIDQIKFAEKSGKEMAEAHLKEIENREIIKQLILDAQLAAGEITQKEYDRLQTLQKQKEAIEELRKAGATPEQIAAVEASYRKANEKGDGTSVRDGLSSWMEKTEKELADFGAMAESVADGVASEFGTAFSGILQGTTSLSEGLGNAFKNIGQMFADMVAQMLVKWAMLSVMKGLLPGMAEGGVVNASGGGGMPSLIPGLANGGVVTGPTMAMVGEGRFNEAVVPLPNGKAIPVDMNGGAGNNISTNITVNVNNGQVSSKSSGAQGNDLARNLEGAVKQVIMREMQPGGMISKGR